MQQVFKRAGIEINQENRKSVDEIIHKIVGVKYKDCSATWREVKKELARNENEFVLRLRQEWRRTESVWPQEKTEK
jgi:hypothetical protein